MDNKHNNWASLQFIKPQEGVFVHTKIMDNHGERNHAELKFERNLWWSRDGMYVYYQPTHWAYIHEKAYCSYY